MRLSFLPVCRTRYIPKVIVISANSDDFVCIRLSNHRDIVYVYIYIYMKSLTYGDNFYEENFKKKLTGDSRNYARINAVSCRYLHLCIHNS